MQSLFSSIRRSESNTTYTALKKNECKMLNIVKVIHITTIHADLKVITLPALKVITVSTDFQVIFIPTDFQVITIPTDFKVITIY